MNEVYPKSINEENTCFLLEKGIYGLCQVARQFWKKFVQEMSKLDFKISPEDLCLLYQEDKTGTCMIIIYVDEMLVIGNKNIIEELKTREHATYRSGVGTLLYLTKHSRPDLCNAV